MREGAAVVTAAIGEVALVAESTVLTVEGALFAAAAAAAPTI